MDKQDLREYGDGELSLVVMNDEGLYGMVQRAVRRWWSDQLVIEQLDEMFLYTSDQLADFLETLQAERDEHAAEEEADTN